MFQYLLTFFLINSCYQSLGNPAPKHQLFPLTNLAKQCENPFLSNAITKKIDECAALTLRDNIRKQIRCFIFYDINQQLCAAVAASQLALTQDFSDKIIAEQNIDMVCTLAKNWVFTNISGYENFKNRSEIILKSPSNCGEVCGVEDTLNAANDYCKYYKWGIETLQKQSSTESTLSSNNLNEVAVNKPATTKSESTVKTVVSASGNAKVSDLDNTNALDVQIKQTESVIQKSTPKYIEDSGDVVILGNQKSTAQATSTKQTINQNSGPTGTKKVEVNVNALEHPILPIVNEQSVKGIVTKDPKQIPLESDPGLVPESGKDALVVDKDTDLEKVDGKDDPDYTGNEGDDPEDDPDVEMKLEKTQESTFIANKPIASHNSVMSSKEFLPNPMSDGFTEESGNFFPFFMTGVVLAILLYVLYHNKSKVTKVFFGLILEGRQGGRRRNSRGHSYRRLDTLEQAMSGNATAPPSKIIY